MLWSLCQPPTTIGAARDSHVYVRPGDFDFSTLLGGPPPDDSPQHRAEVATMLYLQNRRTAEEVTRCRDEAAHVNVWLFANVLGDDFNKTTHPLTAALFDEIHANAKSVVDAAKERWDRPRPYRSYPDIHPCVHRESASSYPSGHATLSILWATVLADIFPDRRDALLARGKQIGDDRFLAGVHYPSDVAQKLGAEIARRMLANRDFQIELDSVRRECGQPTPQRSPAPTPMDAEPATTP
jgi:acid phosphatase (class A)